MIIFDFYLSRLQPRMMKIKSFRLALVLFAILAISSCGIYRQNLTNVPLMQQKGQTQMSGSIGYNGYDLQMALALTNKIAVLANYSDLGSKREDYSYLNYTIDNHHFYEIGMGCFKKNTSGLISEYFFNVGKGMTSHFYQGMDNSQKLTSKFQEVSYNRFCFQADFGQIKNNWEYAISPRILLVNYYNIYDNNTQSYQNEPSTFLYADMTSTVRYKFLRYFKIYAQVNATLPITGFNSAYYSFSPFNANIGFMIDCNLFKTRKQ